MRCAAYEKQSAAFPSAEVMAEGIERFSRGGNLSARCCLRRYKPCHGGALYFMVVNQCGGLDSTEWLDRASPETGVVWHGTMGKPTGYGEDRIILEADSWEELVRMAKQAGVFSDNESSAPCVETCAATPCSLPGTLVCSRCKAVRYCSKGCQASHWRAGHKTACGEAIRPSKMDEPTFVAPPGRHLSADIRRL